MLHAFGAPITPYQTNEVALRLYRPVLTARAQNYTAAVHYLNGLELPDEIVIPWPRDYPLQAVTTSIERVVSDVRIVGEPITEETRTDIRAIELARKAIEGPLVRQALEPARETIADIGKNEEYPRYGFARVLVGPYSCSFCAMLASRGAVYTSYAAAKGKGGSPMDVFHTPGPDKRKGSKGAIVGGFCDCSVVQVRRDVHGNEMPWEGQQAQLELAALWNKHQGDLNAKGKRDPLNAFRREWERRVRAGETQKYLAPSLQKAS